MTETEWSAIFFGEAVTELSDLVGLRVVEADDFYERRLAHWRQDVAGMWLSNSGVAAPAPSQPVQMRGRCVDFAKVDGVVYAMVIGADGTTAAWPWTSFEFVAPELADLVGEEAET